MDINESKEKPTEIKKRRLTGKAAELAEEVTPESLEETRKKMIAEEKYWQNIRERAAIAAMQGMLAGPARYGSPNEYAKLAVSFADALIEELKKK
jgi:hypothetical protein